ncbi:XRE family transcriptional regulator [Staphylococcus xylosus]|uniref:helix-turn-helix domain-containing protein n=1 Tax=Staphylococcus TaxID=1279 RepID=UPI000E67E098|nr:MULTISPECIES: helix-turn-helix transcriptional regulator [Staphylococcus]MCE5003456.1 helix-turn-helix transcriptional regulator [Staphylococcus pseudoxylosus]RIM89003.1 XRE family transcriptional regulator [Staphylococcus xylosus]
MREFMSDKELKQFITVLSNEFRIIRKSKKLTLEDVSFDIELSASHLGKIENGRLNKMSVYMYAKLASYYDVKLSDIIDTAERKYEANKIFFD